MSKPLMQVTEKPPLVVLQPSTSKVQDIAIPVPNFATPQVKSKGDTSTKMIDRKTVQEVGREIPVYPDPVYRPFSKPVIPSMPNIPGSLPDIDPELNMDFNNNNNNNNNNKLMNL